MQGPAKELSAIHGSQELAEGEVLVWKEERHGPVAVTVEEAKDLDLRLGRGCKMI